MVGRPRRPRRALTTARAGPSADRLAAIAGTLPRVDFIPPESPVLDHVRDALAGCAALDDVGREQSLFALANVADRAPAALLRCLLSRGFEARRADEAFLVLVAYLYFLIERIDEAGTLAGALYDAGGRSGFLLDVVVRCLIERGATAEARRVLADNPAALAAKPELMSRLAGLAYIDGRTAEADAVAARVRSRCRPRVLDRVERSYRRMDELLMAPESDRRRDGAGVIDFYAEPNNQHRAWTEYAERFDERKSRLQNDCLFLTDLFVRELGPLIAGGEAGTVVNFGSLFGWMEFDLARRHPTLNVVGYDRSPVATARNRERFRAPNLTYASGAFADAVAPFADGRGFVVTHGRTASLMYPEELRRFYADCRRLGATRIVAVEDLNFALATGRFPDFASGNRASLVMGGHVMMHDYPYYLAEAGFRLESRRHTMYTLHLGRRMLNADAMVIEIIHARVDV